MTTVDNNTFEGPNSGTVDGYEPYTIIESGIVDDDFTKVKADLDYHLSILQAIYIKLDTIDLNAADDQTVSEIVTLINASVHLIDDDNLAATITRASDLTLTIEAHRITTTPEEMHTENSIKSTEQTYSFTPTSLITTCSNILDEINNIRLQIDRIIGSTYWSDTPAITISAIDTSLSGKEDVSNKNVANGYVGLNVDSDIDLNSTRKIKNPEGLQLPVGTNKWV